MMELDFSRDFPKAARLTVVSSSIALLVLIFNVDPSKAHIGPMYVISTENKLELSLYVISIFVFVNYLFQMFSAQSDPAFIWKKYKDVWLDLETVLLTMRKTFDDANTGVEENAKALEGAIRNWELIAGAWKKAVEEVYQRVSMGFEKYIDALEEAAESRSVEPAEAEVALKAADRIVLGILDELDRSRKVGRSLHPEPHSIQVSGPGLPELHEQVSEVIKKSEKILGLGRELRAVRRKDKTEVFRQSLFFLVLPISLFAANSVFVFSPVLKSKLELWEGPSFMEVSERLHTSNSGAGNAPVQ